MCNADGVRFLVIGRTPAERESERNHGDQAQRSRRPVGRAPAMVMDHEFDDRRPERGRDVVAGRGNADRNAAPSGEPMGDIGDQRREGCRGAEADQHLGGREQRQRRGGGREGKAGGETQGAWKMFGGSLRNAVISVDAWR